MSFPGIAAIGPTRAEGYAGSFRRRPTIGAAGANDRSARRPGPARFPAARSADARSAWVQHIRSNPRNAPTVGGAADLELFLFGGARVDLSAARAALQDMQENRCFYCGSAQPRIGSRSRGPLVAGRIPGRSTRSAAGSALGLRPSRGHVGAALGEPEIHGQCRSAVPGDTGRVRAGP